MWDSLSDLNADVAQIQHRQARSFGSGRLIAPGVILTAGHVVDGVDNEPIETGWEVRLMVEQPVSPGFDPAAWAWRRARVGWRGSGALDLALMICDSQTPTPVWSVEFGQCRLAAVESRACGFPRSGINDDDERDIRHVVGHALAHDDQHPLQFTVSFGQAPKEREAWRGFSGSVVLSQDSTRTRTLSVLGVVSEVPADFSAAQLRIARIDAALKDKRFRSILTHALGREPVLTPSPAAAAPMSELSVKAMGRLHTVLYTFDREDQADLIGTLLDRPPPVEIVVYGSRDDSLDLFAERLRQETLCARARVAEDLPLIVWPVDDKESRIKTAPEERFNIVQFRLAKLVNGLGRASCTPADLYRALSSHQRAWVRLHLCADQMHRQDINHLAAWRKLWRDTARLGVLPPCGVVYTVEGEAGNFPAAMNRVFANTDPGVRRAPITLPISLPICTEGMLEHWPDRLITKTDKASARALHRLLHAEKPRWTRFRLRQLKTLLDQ